jgi:D-3-phosphoglycerate dehydrogenase
LTVGVVGFGRLGAMYATYCQAFGSRVIVYDPYKTIEQQGIAQVNDIYELYKASDIISLHVHVTPETLGMVNADHVKHMKEDVVFVNTSRGDIVNEEDMVAFLRKFPNARVATDVLTGEIRNRLNSPILKYAAESDQVIITPHIGGMSREAQEIAYGHAAIMLKEHFSVL